MSNVTASMVKELRDRTGVGMGKCKQALDEAKGNIDEAINILRKSGMASAIKKEARETNEGMIGFAENAEGVALVEVNAETDFVVQNEKFQEFVKELCEIALESAPADLEAFNAIKTSQGRTVDELRAEHVQSLGENIKIRRSLFLPIEANTSIGIYSHMGGKIVSAVEITGSQDHVELARALAMHVAAEFPEYVTSEDIPVEVIEREKEIARSQVANKPANIQEKIIEGKLKAFYEQTCLIHQKYVRDPSMTIAKVLEEESKTSGKTLAIKRFIRWQMGM